VCLAGHSFTGGVDDKPSIEVLALVRCMRGVRKIRGIAYVIRRILLVETVIIYKCVINSVTCT
jgi:hypothetical protein